MAEETDTQTPQREAVDPASASSAVCSCWSDRNEKLREKGFIISLACSQLVITKTGMKVQYGLPLQKSGGTRLKRNDPQMITIAHCPFCGSKL